MTERERETDAYDDDPVLRLVWNARTYAPALNTEELDAVILRHTAHVPPSAPHDTLCIPAWSALAPDHPCAVRGAPSLLHAYKLAKWRFICPGFSDWLASKTVLPAVSFRVLEGGFGEWFSATHRPSDDVTEFLDRRLTEWERVRESEMALLLSCKFSDPVLAAMLRSTGAASLHVEGDGFWGVGGMDTLGRLMEETRSELA